jgi:hypothetical protein
LRTRTPSMRHLASSSSTAALLLCTLVALRTAAASPIDPILLNTSDALGSVSPARCWLPGLGSHQDGRTDSGTRPCWSHSRQPRLTRHPNLSTATARHCQDKPRPLPARRRDWRGDLRPHGRGDAARQGLYARERDRGRAARRRQDADGVGGRAALRDGRAAHHHQLPHREGAGGSAGPCAVRLSAAARPPAPHPPGDPGARRHARGPDARRGRPPGRGRRVCQLPRCQKGGGRLRPARHGAPQPPAAHHV